MQNSSEHKYYINPSYTRRAAANMRLRERETFLTDYNVIIFNRTRTEFLNKIKIIESKNIVLFNSLIIKHFI